MSPRLSLFLAAALLACRDQPAPVSVPESVRSVRGYYDRVHGHLVRSAEMMPDSAYEFRPTEGVRTFREILGHVADSEFQICGAALDEQKRSSVEATARTKASLVQALNDAGAFCARAFDLGDANTGQRVEAFGMQMSRLEALMFVTTHDWEHYGNLVTYMRMKSMTPPSSQR